MHSGVHSFNYAMYPPAPAVSSSHSFFFFPPPPPPQMNYTNSTYSPQETLQEEEEEEDEQGTAPKKSRSSNLATADDAELMERAMLQVSNPALCLLLCNGSAATTCKLTLSASLQIQKAKIKKMKMDLERIKQDRQNELFAEHLEKRQRDRAVNARVLRVFQHFSPTTIVPEEHCRVETEYTGETLTHLLAVREILAMPNGKEALEEYWSSGGVR